MALASATQSEWCITSSVWCMYVSGIEYGDDVVQGGPGRGRRLLRYLLNVGRLDSKLYDCKQGKPSRQAGRQQAR